MPYSESLAQRLRHILKGHHGFLEKKMFGGVGFLLQGNMCVGIWKNSLIARIDPDQYESALSQTHVQEFDITGRPMRGWIMIDPDGLDTDDQLFHWVQAAIDFVGALPKKPPAKKPSTKKPAPQKLPAKKRR